MIFDVYTQTKKANTIANFNQITHNFSSDAKFMESYLTYILM